jgi:serine/threonine protein kinase
LSKKGKLPTLSAAQAVEIASQVMRSVQALHLVGYTHNDIKPANIAIDFTKEGKMIATLIDFGFS